MSRVRVPASHRGPHSVLQGAAATRVAPRVFFLAALLLMACACATAGAGIAGPVLRPAIDAPARFVVPPEPPGTVPGANCRSPLTDGRDGTEIKMERAAGGVADYAVPTGRYGVDEGELLRVRCETGEPLGIVRR